MSKKGLGLNEFMDDVTSKGSTDIIGVRDKESNKLSVAFSMLDAFHKRSRHWAPTLVEQEVIIRGKKKNVKKYINMPYVCPNINDGDKKCPYCKFINFLRDENIDLDEEVLKFGTGKDTQVYLAGDVIGEQGYDWKHDLRTKIEYLITAVDIDEVEKGKRVLAIALTTGRAIKNVIQSSIDDTDEETGNPFITPYPFNLTYNPDEIPAKKYSAQRSQKKLKKAVRKLIKEEPLTEVIQKMSTPARIYD